MKIFGITITTKAVVALGATALSQAVAAAAQRGNPIGDAAHKAVAAVEGSSLSGIEKKSQVISAIFPVIVGELAKGGITEVIKDVEQFAGMVVEEVVGQFKQTTLLSIAMTILRLLGVK